VRTLVGNAYGKLTAVWRTNLQSGGHPIYLCRCLCGNPHLARSTHLTSNKITQCRQCRNRQTSQTKRRVSTEDVRRLLSEGHSQADIARHFNVTRTCIHKICRKYLVNWQPCTHVVSACEAANSRPAPEALVRFAHASSPISHTLHSHGCSPDSEGQALADEGNRLCEPDSQALDQ
jgi:hypothetical protein